jgi:hypothetical protein
MIRITGSEMNIPDLIFENSVSVFLVKSIEILWCRSGIRDTVNPGSGSGMEKVGSGKLKTFRIRNIGHKAQLTREEIVVAQATAYIERQHHPVQALSYRTEDTVYGC